MSVRTTVQQTLQFAAIGVGVTALGLVGGAMLVSPAIPRAQIAQQWQRVQPNLAAIPQEQWLIAAGVLAAAAAAALITRTLKARRSGSARRSGGASGRTTQAPTITLRGGKSSRTPRAVQALAAAGAAPAEIAWKTGLPVDAVAMLLDLSGSRQVTPPLA